MKTTSLYLLVGFLLFAACGPEGGKSTVIKLTYTQTDIHKAFDTLYNNQQTKVLVNRDSILTYTGCMEQALAYCHIGDDSSITQDVLSSMYINQRTGNYDCVTTTTFQFKDGTIAANGLFNLTPGATIAPDHDFPITGGSGAYRNIYGTYTREYSNGVYYVVLNFKKIP